MTSDRTAIIDHASGLHPLLPVLIHAAWTGEQYIHYWYTRDASVTAKSHHADLSTEADLAAESAICTYLNLHADSYLLVTEEAKERADYQQSDRLITVDPLDGTGAYAMRCGPQYPSTALAAWQDGHVACGVIIFPLSDECYYFAAGRGAWCQTGKVTATPCSPLSASWVDINRYGDTTFETPIMARLDKALRMPGVARLVTNLPTHSGVACRIAHNEIGISAALHDNDPDNIKQDIWDVLPAQGLITEAGGAYLNLLTGRTYDPWNPGPIVVAADPLLAGEIVAIANAE